MGKSNRNVVRQSVDGAKAWWRKGGIVTMQLHWVHSSNPNGSACLGRYGPKEASEPFDFASTLKPGRKVHKELMRHLKGRADFLEQLADARVPVLWRPFHEIDRGRFWWTDPKAPEHTGHLWRAMLNYFVRKRKLHNLI